MQSAIAAVISAAVLCWTWPGCSHSPDPEWGWWFKPRTALCWQQQHPQDQLHKSQRPAGRTRAGSVISSWHVAEGHHRVWGVLQRKLCCLVIVIIIVMVTVGIIERVHMEEEQTPLLCCASCWNLFFVLLSLFPFVGWHWRFFAAEGSSVLCAGSTQGSRSLQSTK